MSRLKDIDLFYLLVYLLSIVFLNGGSSTTDAKLGVELGFPLPLFHSAMLYLVCCIFLLLASFVSSYQKWKKFLQTSPQYM